MPAFRMAVAGPGGSDFTGKLTSQVLICSIIAAFGGLMFGYDIGISGGVTSMDDFLIKFFPTVYERKHRAKEDNYCKYDNQFLQLFTSSLYLAAIVFSLLASFLCKTMGRKPTMQIASLCFFVGVIFNVTAMNLPMLIIGRICLGAGVGFANQAVPLFISEISPPKYRGGLNICFQLLITVGILIANTVNYGTSKIHPWGWRLSLGGAGVPAIFLGLGSLIIVETPTSLIERGKNEEGLATLKKIRGTNEVNKEYEEILKATDLAKQVKHPFRNLIRRSRRGPLVCGTILQIFQQFTGINVIMFYAPVLFQTMGFGGDASLLSAVATGTVNSVSTLVAVFCVDKIGRKVLLIQAAVQMLLAQTRTAGFFCAVSMNMFCTFLIAQVFLTMLCHMKSGICFFFAVWIVLMGAFAIFMLPETKGVSIDEMNEKVWRKHWFWKRFFDEDELKTQDKGEDFS
ncbi:Major facilitator, sugar transporter-like [Dillenia turbinata]|uniref:Major facilitator, sugar transporter-like n=1 Tax=Dillenia turbinata TaxID=194707 RepID=A0AAN8VL86_9MAGN